MLLRKTEFEMLSEAMESLIQEGTITNMTIGSRVRTLLTVMTKSLGRTYRMIELDEMMRVLSTARGDFLDLIGDMLGTDRLLAGQPYVTQDDQCIKFYSKDGNPLVDHLPSGTIPVNTEITTEDGNIVYTTPLNTVFSSVQNHVFVAATCSETGIYNNVGAGMLTQHSLGTGNILVTNQYSIDTGTEVEDDDNYRFRISNSIKSRARANAIAVRLAALSVAGVADAIINDYRSGVGTFEVLIVPVGNRVSSLTMRQVKAAVDNVKALGIGALVKEPSYIHVELAVELEFNNRVTEGEQDTIKTQVEDNILTYLGSIPMGGVFILNEFRERVMATSPNIRDMEILCYVFRNRPQLQRNYQAQSDELFTPSPTANPPILVL